MRERSLRRRFVRKACRGVGDLELLPVGLCRTADLPIVLGHERHTLALALDYQGKRGSLHTTGGAHVAKAAELGEREVTGENRAPDEIDVLAGLTGVGQILVELDEVREGLGHLALDERRIARAAGGQLGCDLAHHVEGVGADELSLAVEVRGDDDLVGLLGEIFENADDLLLRGKLHNGRPREVRKALDLPALDGDAVG